MTLTFAPQPTAVAASTERAIRRSRWPWLLALAAFGQYLLTAMWLVASQQFLIADGVERTANAMAIGLSRDPHLGAMGLYWMPLPMLARIPVLLALRPFRAGIYAGPVASALAAALVIPVLARIGARLRLRTSLVAALVVLYAFNPVTIWHAANGMSESWFALCMALVLLAWVDLALDEVWVAERLARLGLALGVGMASRFEFIPICAAAGLAVLVAAPRGERRQSLGMALAPAAVVFFFWSLASSLLAGDAFSWYSLNKQYGRTPDIHPWMPDDLTFTSITWYVVSISLVFAPALGLALVAGAMQRRSARGFVGLALIVLAYPGVNWFQLMGRTGVGAMRYFGLLPLLGCVCAMWAVAHAGTRRRFARPALAIASCVLTLLGIGATTLLLADPVRTSIEQEHVFFRALLGREPAEVKRNLGGFAELAELLDPHLTAGRLAAMDAKGGWLTLFTDHPERFLIPYDRDWEEIMSDPDGRFDFVIKPNVDTGVTFGSDHAGALDAAMNAFTGGEFVLVASNAAGEIWEFVPTGGTPSIQSV